MATFKTEEELYNASISMLSTSVQITDPENCLTYLVNRNGRRLHLVGEKHQTREPLDYTHNNLVPLMVKDPSKWMIVREGLEYHAKNFNVMLKILMDWGHFWLSQVIFILVNLGMY